MDSKRKANGNAAAEADDRSSKRRKLAEFDLSKGETRESTTAYGLSFMEQIRRTADKSGRLVATYFEKLLPRKGNEEYYKSTRMPIALETIEQKLNQGDFQNLAELESYFKRMICNAKDFYPRSSSTFEDAERVRKALSNYMTKTNPAYGTRGYQAHPTPLPPEEANEEEEKDEGDKQEAQEAQTQADKGDEPQTQETGDQGHDKASEEQEEEQEEDQEEDQEQKEDAEGEEEVDEATDKQDDSMASGRSSRRRSIVLKRRGNSRLPKTQAAQARESPRRSVVPTRPDHQYFKVPYKDLTFQQAQEKAVEEMLRYSKADIEGYFEPFQNLPPRSLKDYYKVIDDPMSLKKLQKMVKGIHGRNGATGVSVFKSWSAMAEKAKLLWTNAMYYNEEGSEIFELALELQKAFEDELKKAQLAVPEPAQPKIKLKVGQPEAPTGKKITIHVGGRGGSADSPAPQTAPQTAETPAAGLNGSTRTSSRLEAARSFSGSVPSPSPSRQMARSSTGPRPDDSALHMAPVTPLPVQPPVMVPAVPQSARMLAPAMHPHAAPPMAMHPQPQHAMPMTNGYVEHRRLRRPGKGAAVPRAPCFNDALLSRLRIQLHPTIQPDRRDVALVYPSPAEPYQSATVNLPAHQSRVFVVLMLPDFLCDREYSLWVLVDRQPLKPCMHPLPNQLPQERTFELILRPGVNVIEAHLVAAVPAPERIPGGPEVDLEVFTVFTNLMRP
ncbi:hypothetical protein CDD81_80 [Ophiocordyceps australis]|uniref:Bromo domain-containing protein n=1 Tax=Ophiocordyceps australis TaxID=1399860 RepID=A0A2C5YF11_9HYPO|nr:hypothetical protein CDD81_80 [Ophiocordyceps australis]